MTQTTPEQRQRLRERLSATKLPWHVGPYYKSDIESPAGRIAECQPSHTPHGAMLAGLITDALNAVPALLADLDAAEAEIERLRADNERLAVELQQSSDMSDWILNQQEESLANRQELNELMRTMIESREAEIERLRALLLEAANELTPLVATSPASSNVTIHSIVINGKKPLERRIRDALENKP